MRPLHDCNKIAHTCVSKSYANYVMEVAENFLTEINLGSRCKSLSIILSALLFAKRLAGFHRVDVL